MHGMRVLRPDTWAKQQFGPVELGDRRRTRRAMMMAGRMMRCPSDSLPYQMGSCKALKAAYRLLGEEDVTYEALSTPHWEQTCDAAREEALVLIVQDTTHMDYTHHPKTTGLGPIGDGNGQGFLLHSALGVVPAPRRVLGIMYQHPFVRQPVPAGETKTQRQQRERESGIWARAVHAIGSPPPGCQWVHIGDRSSDIFEFLAACCRRGCDFLIRAGQDRRAEVEGEGADPCLTHLLTFARSLPAQGEKTIDIPARHGCPARRARVMISCGHLTLQPPHDRPHQEPLEAWVVRAWEVEALPQVEEPLEWILVTSLPTETLAEAETRLEWYTCRWLTEDYHQCLKTGCRIEKRQLQDGEPLFCLLGFLAPVAVRLLQLREIARLEPERLATDALPGELVNLVAHLAEVPPATLRLGDFWRHVAGLGGYLGRRRDGPPGWKTLWRGWLYVQTLLEGVHLATSVPP